MEGGPDPRKPAEPTACDVFPIPSHPYPASDLNLNQFRTSPALPATAQEGRLDRLETQYTESPLSA